MQTNNYTTTATIVLTFLISLNAALINQPTPESDLV